MIIKKDYNFKKFDGNYFRGDSIISVNRSGLIRLSSGFCRTTEITQFEHVLLYFDEVNKAIAFKFMFFQEDGALKVTKDNTGATISAKSFFLANDIDLVKVFGRYTWTKEYINGIGDLYIIELVNK